MSESQALREAEIRAGGRHRAREVALQVLYAVDVGHYHAGFAADPESDAEAGFQDEDGTGSRVGSEVLVRSSAMFDRIAENFDVPASAIDFARELVAAVTSRSQELDALLGIHARNWRVTRMAAVDRNVLRMAVYELRDTETPVAVVIDEAVDLARRFGSDRSSSFVNGVLDAVAREVRAA